MANRGCTNRPFYHIVVAEVISIRRRFVFISLHRIQSISNWSSPFCHLQKFREVKDQAIEQVGSFDPMLNENNEKLVALNFERIQWWLGEGVEVSKSAAYILGRCQVAFHSIVVCIFDTFFGCIIVVDNWGRDRGKILEDASSLHRFIAFKQYKYERLYRKCTWQSSEIHEFAFGITLV